MNNQVKTVREPLLHIVKRGNLSISKKITIYAIAIIGSLLLGAIICSLVSPRGDVFKFFSSLFEGCFSTSRKTWAFVRELAILLAVSMSLIISFKMKFWNLGGNGQILMGGLAAIICDFYLGGKVNETLLIIIVILASIVAGALWAAIPAICKVIWNTNETLFTLMLNYIASGLVSFFIALWSKNGSGICPNIIHGKMPVILGNKFLLAILFGAIVTTIITIYLKYTKQGYELSVVGDSQNTARYIGINVKKVVIRTLIISGAICGLVGLILTSGVGNDYNKISSQTSANLGFTAIMTTWLANCNPLFAILTCLLNVFVSKGVVDGVRPNFGMNNDSISNLVIGFVYFFIIACAFFTQYKIIFSPKAQKVIDKITKPFKWLINKIKCGILFVVNKIKKLFSKKETERGDE